jgi:hypothetical protein
MCGQTVNRLKIVFKKTLVKNILDKLKRNEMCTKHHEKILKMLQQGETTWTKNILCFIILY